MGSDAEAGELALPAGTELRAGEVRPAANREKQMLASARAPRVHRCSAAGRRVWWTGPLANEVGVLASLGLGIVPVHRSPFFYEGDVIEMQCVLKDLKSDLKKPAKREATNRRISSSVPIQLIAWPDAPRSRSTSGSLPAKSRKFSPVQRNVGLL